MELAGALLPRPGGRALLLSAGAALLALQGLGTYQRNRVWRTDLTLWQSATEASPENGRAWQGLAIAYLDAGRPDAARPCLARADALGHVSHILELAYLRVALARGDQAAGLRHSLRAIQLAPNEGDVYFGHAVWLHEYNHQDEAIAELETGLALSPSNLFARQALQQLYEAAGRRSDYCRLARETVALSGNALPETNFSSKCVAGTPSPDQPPARLK